MVLNRWIHIFMLFLTVDAFADQTIKLEGHPIQLEWFDLDGDTRLDLVALMLRGRTEGTVETYFENGKLRGIYEDQTFREKYLTCWLQGENGWREAGVMQLGRETVLGFAMERGNAVRLMLWSGGRMHIHEWREDQWEKRNEIPTPGLLAGEAVHLSQFPFWHQSPKRSYWLVPDLDGIHVLTPDNVEGAVFIPYPESAISSNNANENRHRIEMTLPEIMDVDGDKDPDMVFLGQGRGTAWRMGQATPAYDTEADGVLLDVNGDGLVDLIHAEEEGEIEKRKDLPKVKSRIKTYLATRPFVFPVEPDFNQVVPGFVLNGGDSDIELPNPFEDINGDGRPDVVGFAVKVSLFQIAKVVTTGRLTLKFLMNLSLQEPDGRYRTLAGGPFEMVWKINIRSLKMPALAQMTADFDGDGWIDILMDKGGKVEVTPVTASGYGKAARWSLKIPKSLRDPDQLYGKDLDGNRKAELILMKIDNDQTVLGILGHDR